MNHKNVVLGLKESLLFYKMLNLMSFGGCCLTLANN